MDLSKGKSVVVAVVDDRRDRDRRGNGRRWFSKGSSKNDRFEKENVTVRIQKPRNTSSEKKTGFVIRNKGDNKKAVHCGGSLLYKETKSQENNHTESLYLYICYLVILSLSKI